MPTDDKKDSWSPGAVFKEDPAAERGFDEQQLHSTIDDFAGKYGSGEALAELAKAVVRMDARIKGMPSRPG